MEGGGGGGTGGGCVVDGGAFGLEGVSILKSLLRPDHTSPNQEGKHAAAAAAQPCAAKALLT